MTNLINKTLALLATAFFLGAVGAQAAILTVDNTADSGPGTLRQALIDANTNGAANDIVFSIPTTDPGYSSGSFTILLASELPSIPVSAINITNGQSQAIAIVGNGSFRIFTLVNSAAVVMTHLTISGGQAGSPARASKTLLGTPVKLGGIGYGLGGGIYMGDSGTLTLNSCTVSNNHAVSLGGGIYMNNSATLHVTNSTFSGNSASDGGAIFINDSGTVNLGTSTLSGNSAEAGDGGAIYNGTFGTLNGVNNTFDGNTASARGGAIFNTATMTLTASTITSNSADNAGGLYNGATATINSSIVALNSATTSGNDVVGQTTWGSPFVGNYNLIGNADFSDGLRGAENRSGTAGAPVDPMVGPLQNNGGPTLTRALRNGSPAIDQGNSPGVLTDQRGRSRPFNNLLIANSGDGSDVGAYESILAPTATNVSISGRIVTLSNGVSNGVSNAMVMITNSGGNTLIARTNSFGYFTRTDVPIDTYVITVTHKRLQFGPQMITLVDDLGGLTFVSTN
jgi:predicted outer membrane repeat protein